MSNTAIIKLIVRVTSKVPGFRRAGLAHPAQPQEYPAERFSAEQLQALRDEPNLTIEVIEQAPDNDPGDEQPAVSTEIQPGADGAEGLNGDAAAGAGSPAPAAAAAHSTTEAQTTTAGDDTAPAGGPAAVTEPIVSAKQEGPEVPANGPAPKADAKAAAKAAAAKAKAAAKKAAAKAGK